MMASRRVTSGADLVEAVGGALRACRAAVRDRAAEGAEQAEASNELAAQWVAEELGDFHVERLGVFGGEVMVSRAIAEMLEPAHA